MRKFVLFALIVILALVLSEAVPARGRGKGKKKKDDDGGSAVATTDEGSESGSETGSEVEEGDGKKRKRKKGKGKKKKLRSRKGQKEDRKKLKKSKKHRKTKQKVKDDRRRRQTGKVLGRKKKKMRRSKEERDLQKAACAKKKRGCRGQSDEAVARKANTRRMMKEQRTKLLKAKKENEHKPDTKPTAEEEKEIDDDIEIVFNKTQEAKKAMLKAQGFSENEVEPQNDGLWAGDQMLTVEQADRIIAFQNSEDSDDNVTAPPPPDSSNRTKRYAVFMEQNAGALWTTFPIPYTFDLDSGITEEDKELIRQGVNEIQRKSCITFKELDHVPNESHIFYIKADYIDVCAASITGRAGNQNPVHLNFAECGYQIVGSVVHGTMHSLGVAHEQIRYDRNDYITINNENMDPQMTDLFEPGDNTVTTSYGTKYDYFSIMHMNAWVASVDEDIPVIVPTDSAVVNSNSEDVVTEIMGQHETMSPKDAELLRKMYCYPECEDLEVWCGWWATDGLCETNYDTFLDYCPKSCNFCPVAATELAREMVEQFQTN